MARLDQLDASFSKRSSRYFSESFKQQKVVEIDKKLVSVSDICKLYGVSHTAVYKWIYKYSLMRKKGVRMIVEADSDTALIKALQQHVYSLEQLLGQKQFEIDFLSKQMEIAGEHYGVDFKKKSTGLPSLGSGNIGSKNTPTR